ncbi:MAG: ABC transporter substrate-binding protein [Candidatus Bathyarchaeota archaeon]|nr:ABC transporter substrate-binding protein [Candidatus Bathyarchaeota archaeon]
MNRNLIIGIILAVIIGSSLIIGYSNNWFAQPETPKPEPTATPRTTPSSTPQTTPSPEVTSSPTATSPLPTTSPTATATPQATSPPPTSTPTAKPTVTSSPQPTSQATPTTQPTASPQPTEPSMNLVLEVYGNANMDDAVDEEDLTYLTSIINGSVDATQFSDANNDGTVDAADKDQVAALINGDASYIVLLDGNGKLITVSLPANRIVVEYIQNAEMMRVLELEDQIVGIDYCVDVLRQYYFQDSPNIASVGQMYTPDYEAVLNLNPDVLLTFSKATEEKAEKLPGVDVIFLGLYYPNVTNPEDSSFMQGILKAGYIFDRVPQATEYAQWLFNLTQTIRDKTNNLTAEQQQTVLLTNYPYTESATVKAYATIDTLGQVCILSGGANIASILPTYLNSSSVSVDAEWILEQDPDFIFLHTVRYTFSGLTRGDPAQGYDVSDTTSISQCLQEYIAQPMFANLKAVQNGRVYIIAGDFRNNAMGGVLGSVYLAKVLYPDLFSDLNPQSVHQEYITRFMRLDYNLDEEGVFLYPGISINGDIVGIPNGST